MSNLYILIIFIYFTISKYKIHSFSNIPKYILRMSYYRLELYAKGEKKLPGSWIEAIASYCFHYVSTISRYPHSFHTRHCWRPSLLPSIISSAVTFVATTVFSSSTFRSPLSWPFFISSFPRHQITILHSPPSSRSLFRYSFLFSPDFLFCAYDSSTLSAHLFLKSITRNNWSRNQFSCYVGA